MGGRVMNPIGRVPLPLDRGGGREVCTHIMENYKAWVVCAEALGNTDLVFDSCSFLSPCSRFTGQVR